MKIAVSAACLLLCGCVSQSAVLTNSEGKQTRCANWGFGVIGAPVAMAAQSDCVKKAKAAGYSEVPGS